MTRTIIKVPTELRDRLNALARREQTTLATAITRLLDAAEEHEFWDSVRSTNEAICKDTRDEYVQHATLADDLADEIDDAVTASGSW